MADDRHRCRWADDSPAGRCATAQAFPGVRDVPPFCVRHLATLEPWITARATLRATEAQQWIEWARWKAEDAQVIGQMFGEPGHRRPGLYGTVHVTPTHGTVPIHR